MFAILNALFLTLTASIKKHNTFNSKVITKKPHQQLVHPQSLETIGATSKNISSTDDNNLPLHPQSLETINTKKVRTNCFTKYFVFLHERYTFTIFE